MTPFDRHGATIDFAGLDARLLPGFRRVRLAVGQGHVQAMVGGSGPPVLLLHGDPQTHLCWSGVAPALAARFQVVLADLRGRGESWAPAGAATPDYAKRVMAGEMREAMAALGHTRFAVVGHDRGARVARRLALDHPDAVTRLAVLDIAPALDLYEAVDDALAQEYFYFWFLTQPAPTPERLIAGAPEAFMRSILTGLGSASGVYDDGALDLYVRAAARPEAVAAMCACFRAGRDIDRVDDAADRAAGRRIAAPTLALWGADSVVGRLMRPAEIWARWCAELQAEATPGGHFLPEETPDAVAARLLRFLEANRSHAERGTGR